MECATPESESTSRRLKMHPTYGSVDKVVIESFSIHGMYFSLSSTFTFLDIRFPTSLEMDGSDASMTAPRSLRPVQMLTIFSDQEPRLLWRFCDSPDQSPQSQGLWSSQSTTFLVVSG